MIRVNEKYVIDVDEQNYTVKEDLHRTETRKTKDGIEYIVPMYDTKGYYNTLQGALGGVRDLMLVNGLSEEDMPLEMAIRTVIEVNKIFTDTVNKVMKEVE